MIKSRKDHKGRKLREGESWRKDGRYSYRYMDIRTGKRINIYAQDLPEHIMRYTDCTRMA